jgi:hypothetical protein
MKKHGNRIHQTPKGIWYFKFKFDGNIYIQSNFDTQEQAEQALLLQYKVLNLTTTGQKRGKSKTKRTRTLRKEIFIECNISQMYNDKYKVCLTTPKLVKTLDTLEQARAFRDEHKQRKQSKQCSDKINKPRKQRSIKPYQPKQPNQHKTAIVSSFADKTERARQAVMSKNALNKSIAELNNATRTIVKATTPTIAELSRLAKQHINPRQYYLQQLRDGAYRV